ncbi:MAG TPA: amino acid permease [Anaerolineae bacterium]
MTKTLGRDLGLYAVFTISVGAMIGSGIFVLPGLAETIAGPAVILAYLLAGLIVLPAALSKAEMATAMPEAGGTYLYIDRSMGPLMGTIAGIGAWFSLIFKSAFALVGLGAYLLLFAENIPTKPVALVLAVALIGINIMGVKQTGRLQAIIVTGVLLVLVFFVAEGLTFVRRVNYHPFFSQGVDGLLAATGFVFVSYAGVTKIASVAEEVENPGRNIPVGILASIVMMMLVYTLIVFVIVGVTEADQLGKTLTPMATAAEQFLGTAGFVIVAITAVFALVSMANAGILSSSRYPFAMSRDSLAPAILRQINKRFSTPASSITLTGALLLMLIAFVPVVDLAKLASAFQILVFSLINLTLIFFRESELEWYRPSFRAPGYPWVQVFGIVAGLVLLTQMGILPFLGAVGIILSGFGWYRYYGRPRTSREGVALETLRRATTSRTLAEARIALSQKETYRILIPVHPDITPAREETLLHIAADLVRGQRGQIQVIRLIEVPQQVSLRAAADVQSPEDVSFEKRTDSLAQKLGVQVEVGELVSHDTKRAVVNYARQKGVDLVLAEVDPRHWRIPIFGSKVEWLMDHLPCDSIFVKNRGLENVQEIVVIGERGPYEPLEIVTANAIALEQEARIRFIHVLNARASDAQITAIKAYHQELTQLHDAVATESEVVRMNKRVEALKTMSSTADLCLVNTSAHRFFPQYIFGDFSDRVADVMNCTVLLVHARNSHRHTFLRHALERLVH